MLSNNQREKQTTIDRRKRRKEVTNAVDGKYLILACGAKTKRSSLLKKIHARGTLEKAT